MGGIINAHGSFKGAFAAFAIVEGIFLLFLALARETGKRLPLWNSPNERLRRR